MFQRSEIARLGERGSFWPSGLGLGVMRGQQLRMIDGT